MCPEGKRRQFGLDEDCSIREFPQDNRLFPPVSDSEETLSNHFSSGFQHLPTQGTQFPSTLVILFFYLCLCLFSVVCPTFPPPILAAPTPTTCQTMGVYVMSAEMMSGMYLPDNAVDLTMLLFVFIFN